jgi:hypothetical protein
MVGDPICHMANFKIFNYLIGSSRGVVFREGAGFAGPLPGRIPSPATLKHPVPSGEGEFEHI